LVEVFAIFYMPVAAGVSGMILATSHVRALTCLYVLALRLPDGEVVSAMASMVLEPDCELVLLGSEPQRQNFAKVFL